MMMKALGQDVHASEGFPLAPLSDFSIEVNPKLKTSQAYLKGCKYTQECLSLGGLHVS